MSGVEVHTEDPINTRTKPPSSSSVTTPASIPATATFATAPPKLTAQAGPRAPVPTSSSSYVYTPRPAPTATQTNLSAPARTTTSDGPPQPQPGALPIPDDIYSSRRSASPIPPPPKAGEKLRPAEFYTPQPIAGPTAVPVGQQSVPSGAYAPTSVAYGTLDQPLRSVPPAGVTSTVPRPPGIGTRIVLDQNEEQPRRSIEHPPGYRQDPYASDRAPSQYAGYAPSNDSSAGLRSEERKSSSILGGFSDSMVGLTGSGSGAASGGGILGGGGGGSIGGEESIMSTVSSWAKSVGNKAAELESEVWKRVNGEK